jgi:hypothetical protein
MSTVCPEVQVRRGGVEARLDAKRGTRGQALEQLRLDEQFVAPALYDLDLIVQGCHAGAVFHDPGIENLLFAGDTSSVKLAALVGT